MLAACWLCTFLKFWGVLRELYIYCHWLKFYTDGWVMEFPTLWVGVYSKWWKLPLLKVFELCCYFARLLNFFLCTSSGELPSSLTYSITSRYAAPGSRSLVFEPSLVVTSDLKCWTSFTTWLKWWDGFSVAVSPLLADCTGLYKASPFLFCALPLRLSLRRWVPTWPVVLRTVGCLLPVIA